MNKYFVLLAPLLGWLVAQAIKYIVSLRKDGLQIKDLYSSGGFPSSHTSSTIALAVYIGCVDGFSSHLFAVSAVLAAVVMYDAIGVRRTVGEHTHVLAELSDKKNQKHMKLHPSFGHTPSEVVGGFVVGCVVGYGLFLFT